MLQKRYQTFGLVLTLPFLLANSQTANLSETKLDTMSLPTPEIQPVVETSTESILLIEESQLPQSDTQNRREGREYCQGIGVC